MPRKCRPIQLYSRLVTRSDLIQGKVPDSSAGRSTYGKRLVKAHSEATSVVVWNFTTPRPDYSKAAPPSRDGWI
jgi:hypothetical protein